MQTVADEEQLALLKRSVEEWNQWRRDNPAIEPSLSDADLSDARLPHVNLVEADLRNASLICAGLTHANLACASLSNAYLINANLGHASLSDVDFKGADLTCASLRGADLKGADLRDADFSSANLSRVDLIDADFSGVNLSNADLSFTDLNGQDLSGVDLSGTNLTGIQALSTNFASATLTGACIEDWHTNSKTNLEGVICDYIYLKSNQQERRPAQGNFAPGDFARLFQKARETLDLIFRNGIDWRSFADTLQEVRKEQVILEPDKPNVNITVREIKTNDDGSLVIRVSVPDSLDKAQLQASIEATYEQKLALTEARYRAELNAKDREIVIYKEQSADLKNILEVLASRPVNINNNINNVQGNAGSVDNKGAIGNSTGSVEGDSAADITPSDDK